MAVSGVVAAWCGAGRRARARCATRVRCPRLDNMEFVATVVRRLSLFNVQSWRNAACFTVVLALAGVCATARAADPAARHPLLNKSAPEFVQRLFIGAGRNFRLSERRGEVVAIGFWTSWCGSCRRYLERLASLDATYSQAGLVVVGISLDDDATRATELARAVGLRFRNGVDTSKALGKLYAVPDVPLTLLIDRAGVVRYVHGELDPAADADLVAEVRELLDE